MYNEYTCSHFTVKQVDYRGLRKVLNYGALIVITTLFDIHHLTIAVVEQRRQMQKHPIVHNYLNIFWSLCKQGMSQLSVLCRWHKFLVLSSDSNRYGMLDTIFWKKWDLLRDCTASYTHLLFQKYAVKVSCKNAKERKLNFTVKPQLTTYMCDKRWAEHFFVHDIHIL